MSTIKEESRLRIEKAYTLSKFALKNKPKGKKVTEIFAEVAAELGYSQGAQVANIYYQNRKNDDEPVKRFKAEKKPNTPAYEN